jgi:hypothetical protein
MPEKKAFVFRWSFNQELNQLFSNKSGQLSGIFLVNTEDWSRETTSLAVAKEAVEKARKIVPSWVFAVEDLAAHEARETQALAAEQKPVPAVVEKLADQFTLFPFSKTSSCGF